MAPTACGTLVVLVEPYPHVFGMAPVTTVKARVGSTTHRKPTERTVQHRFLARGTSRWSDPAAQRTLRHKLHAARRIHVAGQILQDLGSGHQQTPAVQHFRVGTFEVIVQVAIAIAQQTPVDRIANSGYATVVQRVRPRITPQVLQLLGQVPHVARVGTTIHRQDRVVGRSTWLSRVKQHRYQCYWVLRELTRYSTLSS